MPKSAGQQIDAFQSSDDESRGESLGPIHVLRLPQVCKMTGLCRSSIYQLEADRLFPERVKISARSVGWIESEVQGWLRRRVESGRSRNR